MGMFARHVEITHEGGADSLEPCPVCHGSGRVMYPINVTIGIEEVDPCPNGCREMDEAEYRDWLVRRQPYPLSTILEDLHDAYYKSLVDEKWTDPVIHLHNGPRTRGLVGYKFTERPHPRGRVTTDVPVMGLVEGLDRHVYPCTVPPHLPGDPTEVDAEGTLTVRYEYLGAYVTVRFHSVEAGFFRFAYLHDTGFSTSELL